MKIEAAGPPSFMKWVVAAAVVTSTAFLMLIIADSLDFLNDSSGYPIGWEAGGWRYSSHTSYIGYSIVEALFCGAVAVVSSGGVATRPQVRYATVAIWGAYLGFLLLPVA